MAAIATVATSFIGATFSGATSNGALISLRLTTNLRPPVPPLDSSAEEIGGSSVPAAQLKHSSAPNIVASLYLPASQTKQSSVESCLLESLRSASVK